MRHLIAIDEPNAFRLVTPGNLEQVVKVAAKEGERAALLAGGCDLMEQLKTQWRTPSTVINLKQLNQLRGIGEDKGTLTIGALTSLTMLTTDPRVQAELTVLSQAAKRVATPQIRNMGTLGGNLLQDSRCPYYRGGWRCFRAGGGVCNAFLGIHTEHAIFGATQCYTVTPSDLAPAVVALEAEARIYSADGMHTLPAERLFLSPAQDIRHMHAVREGQILTALRIKREPRRRSAFVKYAARKSWDFAQASAAVALVMDGDRVAHARIVLGGVAPIPWRSRVAETHLEGKRLTQGSIAVAAEQAIAKADPLPGNRYKLALVSKAVSEALWKVKP